jgi:hypothetical protein
MAVFRPQPKAGIGERTGRRIEKGQRGLPPHRRGWRTRQDPFARVGELVPLLKSSPKLQALTLLEELQRRYPGKSPLAGGGPGSGG